MKAFKSLRVMIPARLPSRGLTTSRWRMWCNLNSWSASPRCAYISSFTGWSIMYGLRSKSWFWHSMAFNESITGLISGSDDVILWLKVLQCTQSF